MNNKYIATLSKLCLLIASCVFLFTACDNDDLNTNQLDDSKITLKSFGPSPIARGGELRIVGSNVINVEAVEIPGAGEITDIKKEYGKNEIRVIVPQTAEPGFISILTSKEKITSITELTFSEPISIEDFSPKSAKAGDVITIKGDYLNLIKEVIFADDVHVTEFEQSRSEIKVILPAEAQTGSIIISNGADIVPEPEEGEEPAEAGIPILIYTEEELNVTLPSVEKVLDLAGKKPGETITIAGKDFDLVSAIQMPNGDQVEFNIAEDKKTISFVLPDNMTDGEVVMISISGVSVAIAQIGMALPTDVVATPATGLRGGAVIKLTGKNMELVTDITFPGVDAAVSPDDQSATEVTVTMPDAAISGSLLLNTGSGTSVEVAISTLKPAVTSFNPATAFAGSELEIKGTNMDLVAAVIFGGDLKVEVTNPTATNLTVAVPTLANSGNITLVMNNGETVDGGDLTVDKPIACYIAIFPDEETVIQAGSLLSVGVENGDKLTEVQVKGKSTQYILQGGNLHILIPVNAFGNNVPVKLISSNGEVEYTFKIAAAGFVETTLWTGSLGPIAWNEEARIPWLAFDGRVEAGNTLKVTYEANEGGKVEMMGYWWTGLEGPKSIFVDGDGRAIIPVEAGVGALEFVLPQADIDLMAEQGGLQFCGNDVIITKVAVVTGGAPEIELWKGSVGPIDWSGSHLISMDGIIDQIEPGQTMGIEFTSIAGGKIEIMGSWWTGLEGPKSIFVDGDGRAIIPVDADGTLEFTVLAGDIEILKEQDILFCGNDVTVKRIWVK